jgi:hypothetical protein
MIYTDFFSGDGSIYSAIGAFLTIVGLIYAGIQLKTARNNSREEFSLRIDNLFHPHHEEHTKLRPGGVGAKVRKYFAVLGFALLQISAVGCSEIGSTPTDLPGTEMPIAITIPDETSRGISTTACEQIPNEAVVKFLYGLEVPFLESEEQPDGVYCRFESVVVEGQGGDLGRGLAATTLKLWNSVDTCTAVAEEGSGAEVTPPSPWVFVSVSPIPGNPDLILTVTAHDGANCVTVSAPDISSQPLAVWLEFIEAIAGSY